MSLARRKDDVPATGFEKSSPREQVLARYLRLREISKRLHREIIDLVSADAFLLQARRLGLARGKTLLLDDLDALNYVHDLLIHTTSSGRSRAIDRYARSASPAAESDEALMLEAMRTARFAILRIDRRHEAAGLIASDMGRGHQVWLVDVGLEASMPEGAIIATRFYTPEGFSMAAGVNVPFDLGLLDDLNAEMPGRMRQKELPALMDDPRFAEAIYRIALAGGLMDRVAYRDPAP